MVKTSMSAAITELQLQTWRITSMSLSSLSLSLYAVKCFPLVKGSAPVAKLCAVVMDMNCGLKKPSDYLATPSLY